MVLSFLNLTSVLVETGAMPAPTKSRNPTVCGFFFFFKNLFSGFFTFRQLILGMEVFIMYMGSPDCNFMKIAMGEFYFRGTYKNPLLGGFGGVDDL